jgi:hypothetical protein
MPDLLLRHTSKQLFDLAKKRALSERGSEKEGMFGDVSSLRRVQITLPIDQSSVPSMSLATFHQI